MSNSVSSPAQVHQSTLAPENAPSRAKGARILLFLGIAILLAYVPSVLQILNGAWPFADDAPGLIGPWREFARDSLQNGVLPLWNPHSFCGMPFMANGQTAVLYPPNVVYWLFPVRWALWLDALLHNWWIAAGAYALARTLRLSRTSSLVVALCFALGGSVSSHIFTGHMTWHAARAWVPWAMWALLRYLQTGRRSFAVVLSLCFAMQVAAGYPPLVLVAAGLCGGILVAWVGSALLQRRRDASTSGSANRQPILPAGWLSAATMTIVLTACLCAIWILPLREASRLSDHGSGLPWSTAVLLSGSVLSYVRLVLPMFFNGNHDTQWSMLYGAHEETAYISLLPFLLAMGAPFWCLHGQSNPRMRRPVIWLWLFMWPTLILALGDRTPVYGWLFDAFPPFRMFRVPVRWLEIWYLVASLLAGFGFEALFGKNSLLAAEKELKLKRLRTVFAVVGGFAALALAWSVSPWGQKTLSTHARRWVGEYSDSALISNIQQNFQQAAVGQASWTLIMCIGTVLLLNMWLRGAWKWRFPLTGVLTLIVGIDLLGLFWMSTKVDTATHARNLVQWPSAIASRYQRGQRWDTYIDWRAANQSIPLHIDTYGGYDAMNGGRYFDFVGTMEGADFWNDMYQAKRNYKMQRIAGVTHSLVRFGAPPAEKFPSKQEVRPVQLEAESNGWKLWRYGDTWPRLYLSRQLDKMPESRQLFRLKSLAFREFALPMQPAVVGPVAFPAVKAGRVSENERIVSWQRRNNAMEIRVATSAPAALVVGETIWPGWHAWIDGQKVSLEPANYLFRGVEVPGGQSQVRMIYEPQTFRFGSFISLCGLAFVMAFGAHRVLGKRQERALRGTDAGR
jgi:hypothetical protein